MVLRFDLSFATFKWYGLKRFELETPKPNRANVEMTHYITYATQKEHHNSISHIWIGIFDMLNCLLFMTKERIVERSKIK